MSDEPIRCSLCPRCCGALRGLASGDGVCAAGTRPVIARAAPHFGEEPCISGTRGSGTVFFCGCALRCVFCQNSDISGSGALGRAVSADDLSDVFAALVAKRVHNLNLVTAAHFAPVVIDALRKRPVGVPVVYNSGGYESLETLRALDGLVDVYLPDYKFATHDLAARLANAPDYPDVALAAIQEMRRQTGPAVYDADGLMVRGTLVRHLVLPGLSGASMRALSALRDALPGDVPLSLMAQYTPCGAAKSIPGLDRPISAREYARVRAQMAALGFSGYVQPICASGTEMIPAWDGTGI